jgi:hypothetical protein
MALDPIAELVAGMEQGERRAMLIYAAALGVRGRKFDPERLVAYAEKRLRRRVPGESAQHIVTQLSPRRRDFLRKARLAAKHAWRRGEMSEAEAVELVSEAQARLWRAKHGLEYRFLVALLKVPDTVPEALTQLAPGDFVNACYAALFESLRRHGVHGNGASVLAHCDVPTMSSTWWEGEARETLAAILARQKAWSIRGRRGATA